MSLRLEKLSYVVNGVSILDDVNLCISPAESVCLYGSTGAGKSTLGLIASEVLPLDIGRDNVLRLPSQWKYLHGVKAASAFVAPRPAVYIPSNPLDMLIFPAVHDELKSITTDLSKIRCSLDVVGLPQYVLNQELVQLSGGMLQRLALARVLLRAPRLVVADETYEWLDPDGRRVFKEVLDTVTTRGGVVLALQSTAAAQLDGFESIGLQNGKIVPPIIMHHQICGRVRTHSGIGDVVLHVESLSKAFCYGGSSSVPVLQDVCLRARQGEWVGIYGPNGVGKSVLCRIIAGIEKPDSGSISLMGRPADILARRHFVGYLFQFPGSQLPLPRIRDILDNVVPRSHHAAIQESLKGVLPSAGLDSKVAALNPYQQRRVVLSILLARQVGILIIDEPTWGCDADEVTEMLTLLTDPKMPPRVTIVVSHNQQLLRAVCDHLYELTDGHLSKVSGGEPVARYA